MTKRVGVIGYPLHHSLSPLFQQAAFDHLHLDVRYEAWETSLESLAQRIMTLRSGEFLGANVTVPYKEAVIPFLDALDYEADLVGAVNTIVNRDGKLTGHNTDGVGFMRAINEESVELENANALVLGAGGAARAVAFTLARQQLTGLYIANRTIDRAHRLAETVAELLPMTKEIPLLDEAIEEVIGEILLVVNATSLGMRYTDREADTPIVERLLHEDLFVCDLVYNPPETPFLRLARRVGARNMGGLSMLIYQGAASFELWTGMEAPSEVMFAVAKQGLFGV